MSHLSELHPVRVGRCEACLRMGRLNARICLACQTRYGRRIAELIAQARRQPAFAERCLAQLSPRGREAFLAALGSLDMPLKAPSKVHPAQHEVRPLHKCQPSRRHLRIVEPSR